MQTRHIKNLILLTAIASLLAFSSAYGEDNLPPEQRLDDKIQSLKQEILGINRELFMLEEDILYPQGTQITVFFSLDIGEFFDLDSVQLRVDGKIVANNLYTESEVAALRRGGVQRLYQGNLKTGGHELVAYFIGKGPHERVYKRGANVTVEKQENPEYVELKIVDNAGAQQPEFEIKTWE